MYEISEEFDPGDFYEVWKLEGWWWKKRLSNFLLDFLWVFNDFCFNIYTHI